MNNQEDNLRWSSRIILPQHREQLAEREKEKSKQQKPLFDEQQFQDFAFKIEESIVDNVQVKVIVYGEYESQEYKGVITKFNVEYKKVKLVFDNGDFEWIKLEDIVDIF